MFFFVMFWFLCGWKCWILLFSFSGDLVVNVNAARVMEINKLFFFMGIVVCCGDFVVEDGVRILIIDFEIGDECDFGRVIINYSSEEIEIFIGKLADEFYEIVGYVGVESIVYCNNICCWILFG